MQLLFTLSMSFVHFSKDISKSRLKTQIFHELVCVQITDSHTGAAVVDDDDDDGLMKGRV